MAKWGGHLNDVEQSCGVLMKYKHQDDDASSSLRQVCLLEESEAAKDAVVQIFTALWLEERNKHSMWF